MSKILFVEDDLSSNIPALITMFDNLLEPAERDLLIEIENDALVYGATNEAIKAVFKANPCIDVEYSFPGALKAVSEKLDEYLLFIIDRNLSINPYELVDIQAIVPNFSEEMYVQYCEREGDYMLELLVTKDINCSDSFYFMTAYGPGESLRNKEAIERQISFDKFKKENFLEKGKPEDIVRLREITNGFETLDLLRKYRDVFVVFEKGLLSRHVKNELLETLMQMDNHNLTTIKDNLARIRRIFEAIYIEISKRRDDIIPVKLLRGDRGELKVSAIINHLKNNGHIDGVITEFSFKIWSVASDNGSHTPYQNPDYMPTKYTVQSITYALLDILLWMKSILSKSK